MKPEDASDMRSFILREARRDLEDPGRSEFSRIVDKAAREFARKWMERNENPEKTKGPTE